MNFQEEDIQTLARLAEFYWESHNMGERSEYVYPSLPEPYVNLYFPLKPGNHATIKGISSTTDYFRMNTKIFGVRLFLEGFYQLHLCQPAVIANQILDFREIGRQSEANLAEAIAQSDTFESRVELFRSYLWQKLENPLKNKARDISEAFRYLVINYQNPGVIQSYSEKSGFSTRTISRWFNHDIGISPKKIARIVRFNKALYALHAEKETGFYFDFGYFDQAHFLREFKEFTGITPEAYLKMVSDLYN